jgi:hypothetical protein
MHENVAALLCIAHVAYALRCTNTKQMTSYPSSTYSNQVYADSIVNIQAEVRHSPCSSSGLTKVRYSWSQIMDASRGLTQSLPPSFNLSAWSSSSIYIPPYTLKAGQQYRLQLLCDECQDSAVYYDVSVGVRPLVAAIVGGSLMHVSASAPLFLDASASKDPNIDPEAEDAPSLVYQWECFVGDGVLEHACAASDGSPLLLGNHSTVSIPAGTLAPNLPENTYEFRLFVTKEGRSASQASVRVLVVDDPVPSVTISHAPGSSHENGLMLVNPDDRVSLSGQCTSPLSQPVSLEWGLIDSSPWATPLDLNSTLWYPLGFNAENFVLIGGSGMLEAGNTVSTFVYVCMRIYTCMFMCWVLCFCLCWCFHGFLCSYIYIYIYIYNHIAPCT